MIHEEKELLLVDLCGRLPYKVIIHINNTDDDEELYCINISQEALYTRNTKYTCAKVSSLVPIEDCKPYLRPMSSMTEEEKEELKKIFDAKEVTIESLGFIEGGTLEDYISQVSYDFCGSVIDWLNEHHFDYRRLIEKGLALEAPNDMYKI